MPGIMDESLTDLWSDYPNKGIRDRVLECATALHDRDFSVIPVPTASEANRCILSQVPVHKNVFFWDAPVLEELGIIATLEARGNNIKSALPLATGRAGRRRSRIPARSLYLSTASAITMEGMLVKIEPDPIGIFGPGRAPDSMIIIAGFNQIVDTIDDAFRRAKDVCFPMCARRLELDYECAATERCMECGAPSPMCAVNTVVTCRPASVDMTVVLIGERMGR